LQKSLANTGQSLAVGWSPRPDRFLAAADLVIENAGGLTSLEACAAGAALVSYRAIPGHGRDNVRALVQAGITAAPSDDDELVAVVGALLEDAAARADQRRAAALLFAHDPAERILAIAAASGRSGATAARPSATAVVAAPATTSST
jgi:UDP-N-acetylglucosamine:LPS N-acetylglucosamine transferase